MQPQIIVRDNGDLHRYRTELPNMIDDAGLSPYAFRLYAHLKRVAGDSGSCWQSVSTLSSACNMSRGMVTNARKELEKASLINVETQDNPNGGRDFLIITITDIWGSNFQKYATSTPDEQASSQHELASPPHELTSSPGGLKNNPIKNNQVKKVNIPAPKPAPVAKPENNAQYQIAQALAHATGMDFEKNRSRLFKEAKHYHEDDIHRIQVDYGKGGHWFSSDWRGRMGQMPTLAQIRETWGNLKPAGKSNGKVLSAVDQAFAELEASGV